MILCYVRIILITMAIFTQHHCLTTAIIIIHLFSPSIINNDSIMCIIILALHMLYIFITCFTMSLYNNY